MSRWGRAAGSRARRKASITANGASASARTRVGERVAVRAEDRRERHVRFVELVHRAAAERLERARAELHADDAAGAVDLLRSRSVRIP